jgi:holo-[acyl-carrier protein] synthase
VTNNSDGAPSLKLKGSALRRAKKNAITKINLSISHEKDYAVAFVIMEKKNKML